MSLLLTFIGILLLIPAAIGVGLGLYMATSHNLRESGLLFALWWVPGAAAASGVLMRDPVTFVVGLLCWAVAGLALFINGRLTSRARPRTARKPEETPRGGSGERDPDRLRRIS